MDDDLQPFMDLLRTRGERLGRFHTEKQLRNAAWSLLSASRSEVFFGVRGSSDDEKNLQAIVKSLTTALKKVESVSDLRRISLRHKMRDIKLAQLTSSRAKKTIEEDATRELPGNVVYIDTNELDGPTPTQEEFEDAKTANMMLFDVEPNEVIDLMAKAAQAMIEEMNRNSDSSLLQPTQKETKPMAVFHACRKVWLEGSGEEPPRVVTTPKDIPGGDDTRNTTPFQQFCIDVFRLHGLKPQKVQSASKNWSEWANTSF